jgi:hypothetical protein
MTAYCEPRAKPETLFLSMIYMKKMITFFNFQKRDLRLREVE